MVRHYDLTDPILWPMANGRVKPQWNLIKVVLELTLLARRQLAVADLTILDCKYRSTRSFVGEPKNANALYHHVPDPDAPPGRI
jgi:hypothetical protein